MSKAEFVQHLSEEMQKLPMEDLHLVAVTVYAMLPYCETQTSESE